MVNEETAWGRAAIRFADAIRLRTAGRIKIRHYFNGQLFADRQTTDFQLLQQGGVDFAIGSTINRSPQVRELNLFALPFMFPHYGAVDAVQAGDLGRQLFKLIEQKGVVPIGWGENGFRELTNAKRPVRRPEDLQGLRVRVVGIPIYLEVFRALGAHPVSMNWGEAVAAIQQGTVDGQENPLALIVPYRFWSVHGHVTLWHYAIVPLILAVSTKTWTKPQLRGSEHRAEGRGGDDGRAEAGSAGRLESSMALVSNLRQIYGMEVIELSQVEFQPFREKTQRVYGKWASEIGSELVRRTERIVEASRW